MGLELVDDALRIRPRLGSSILLACAHRRMILESDSRATPSTFASFARAFGASLDFGITWLD
jgi:hypothetical protein